MKLLLLWCMLFSSICYSQKKKNKNIYNTWEKAVVNIETENHLYNTHLRDSIIKSKIDSGYSKYKLDSIYKELISLTNITTGTAIYIKFNNRKYLVTAKHVISNEVLVAQKRHENAKGINRWDTLEAIAERVSIRTPFRYYFKTKRVNAVGILNNNFIHAIRPYFFISDSTGDGIGVISLQDKNYKLLDTLLNINGYSPIEITRVISNTEIEVLNKIYTIGFPELVSIVYKIIYPPNIILPQLPEIVK